MLAGVLGVVRSAADAVESADLARSWQLSEGELAECLGQIGRLRSAVERVEVALAGEVSGRGPSSGHGEVDWAVLAEGSGAPRPEAGAVARVFRVARACRRPGLEELAGAFRAGVLPVGKADRIVRFEQQVRSVADPDQLAEQLHTLVAAARDDEDGRGLTERELAQAIRLATSLLRPDRDLEREESRMRAARSLHKSAGPAGMTAYRLLLDPEGAAILDAAVSALSAPDRTHGHDRHHGRDDGQHGHDRHNGRAGHHGHDGRAGHHAHDDGRAWHDGRAWLDGLDGLDGRERDPRSPATRRADALLEIIGRGVAAPGAVPRTEKAQVVVTISVEALLGQLHGAGLTDAGQVLSPATARRLACDGGIIPMVLGSDGAVLDLGRTERLFTPAQRRAIVHRDGGCSYPGCTVPAGWCEAHHVTWWSRGGPTDLDNGALLCQRHHTVVHQRDLTATITPTRVTWHE